MCERSRKHERNSCASHNCWYISCRASLSVSSKINIFWPRLTSPNNVARTIDSQQTVRAVWCSPYVGVCSKQKAMFDQILLAQRDAARMCSTRIMIRDCLHNAVQPLRRGVLKTKRYEDCTLKVIRLYRLSLDIQKLKDLCWKLTWLIKKIKGSYVNFNNLFVSFVLTFYNFC